MGQALLTWQFYRWCVWAGKMTIWPILGFLSLTFGASILDKCWFVRWNHGEVVGHVGVSRSVADWIQWANYSNSLGCLSHGYQTHASCLEYLPRLKLMINVGRYSIHGSSWERINLPVPSELHFATSAGPTLFWSSEIHVLILPNWKKLLRRTLKGRLCPLFCWWTKNAVKYHGTWMLYDALLCGFS